MSFLRIFCSSVLVIAGLWTTLVFKNDKFSTLGITVAQNVQEEELQIYFDDENPNFVENKEKTLAKNLKAGKNEQVSVNVNTAGMKELISLPGIGEVTAQKIIDYRTANGKFVQIDDLKKVSGIGDKKLETMRNFVNL